MDVSYEVQMLLLQKIKNIIIKYISRSTKKNLKFDYDAAGNRVSKSAYTSAGVWIESTYYVRDAQGNVMGTYHENASDSSLSYKWIEQDIYGSARIGMANPDREMVAADTTNEFAYDTLNKRQYELSNHLGNILTVVYDHSIAVDSNGDNLVDYHLADIASVSDYSPFGAPLPNRGFSFNSYRYNFNGKEEDPEAVGTAGGFQDYGNRIYNPSLGRFLSVDPLADSYPFYTPYQFAGNMPIKYIDMDGLEPAESGTEKGQIGEGTIQGGDNGNNYAWQWNGESWDNKGGVGSNTEVKPNSNPIAPTANTNTTPTANTNIVPTQTLPQAPATPVQQNAPPGNNNGNANGTPVNRGGNIININNAVNTLNRNAGGASQGLCARYVRLALEGGGVNTTGHPGTAREYGPYLERWGFNEVPQNNYVPQAGDIIVIQPYQGGHPAGHITMYNGTQWVSDFRQRDFWSGPGYRQNRPVYRIYRAEDVNPNPQPNL